jgi:hypothetical protein
VESVFDVVEEARVCQVVLFEGVEETNGLGLQSEQLLRSVLDNIVRPLQEFCICF